MSKVPFKKFIITFLFFNKSIPFIIDRLKGFGYFIKEDEVKEIFDEVRVILPESITSLINAGLAVDLTNEVHIEWLKTIGVFEFYHYIVKRDTEKEPPEYFKWFSDCLWIHGYRDVMSLVNILLFNDEPVDEISKIVMYKYKKKVGVDAFQFYQKIFWDTEFLSAKDALLYCTPFRDNALIVRKLRSGSTEVTSMDDDEQDGSDVPLTFHDTNYIKWKIGYRDISVPNARDFMERIKADSYYKCYEAMNMTQSVEIIEEEGNGQFGAFDSKVTKKRNVEEQRVKLIKDWMDVYLKADKAMPDPESKADDEDFFGKMQQLELDFEDQEKLMSIMDDPQIMNDIKGDISP